MKILHAFVVILGLVVFGLCLTSTMLHGWQGFIELIMFMSGFSARDSIAALAADESR